MVKQPNCSDFTSTQDKLKSYTKKVTQKGKQRYIEKVLSIFLTTGPTDQLQHQGKHYMPDCDIT